jgi:hypothetical protein
MKRLLASAMLLALAPACAYPATLRDEHQRDIVLHVFSTVEKAFNRKMATLAKQGLPADAREVQNLFPTYGFEPSRNTAVTWRVDRVDATQARVCVTVELQNNNQWQALVLAMPFARLSAATPDCLAKDIKEFIPQQYPTRVSLVKTLNSQQVVKPSWWDKKDDTDLAGASNEAFVCPSLLLERTPTKPSPWYRLEVRYATDEDTLPPGHTPPKNPNKPEKNQPPGLSKKIDLHLTSLSASPGFETTHDCENIKPGQNCSVWVRYNGGPNETLGLVEFALSNGHAQKLTLLGREKGRIKSSMSANCEPLMCSSDENGSSDPSCYFGTKQKPR